jgi:hypothetical protein
VSIRLNLIELLPYLSELYVLDNSVEVGVDGADAPEPILIVHMADRKIGECCDVTEVPEWVKPIYLGAIQVSLAD